MDVQLLGAIANGARIHVYIAPNSSYGLHQAICRAVDDGVSVISASLSEPEKSYSDPAIVLLEQAMQYAAHHHVTVCVSSGNGGSTPLKDAPTELAINYPSSSPWALTCGGTEIRSWDLPTTPESERVWNEPQWGAGGGGFSGIFDAPAWQVDAVASKSSKRGVPDVASNAGYASGCWLWLAEDSASYGVNTSSTGTSAAAPVWAGLVANLNQEIGSPLGFWTPLLYSAEMRAAFQQIVLGNNIRTPGVTSYNSHPGWNPCTGLGRPVGQMLLDLLRPMLVRRGAAPRPASAA